MLKQIKNKILLKIWITLDYNHFLGIKNTKLFIKIIILFFLNLLCLSLKFDI